MSGRHFAKQENALALRRKKAEAVYVGPSAPNLPTYLPDRDTLRAVATRITRSTAARLPQAPGKHDATATACAAVLAVVQDVFRTLLAERNSVVAINALPVEILGDIFYHAQAAARKNWPNSNPLVQPTRVSLVCTHWRAVAISFPWLWSNIDVRGDCPHDLLSSFLKRGRSVSLAVKRTEQLISQVVADHMDRIRELRIYEVVWMEPLLRPAPLLEVLKIDFWRDGFPPELLADNAPKLHTISLPNRSLRPRVDYPVFTTVTTVHTWNASNRGDILRAVFDNFPRLTTLTGLTSNFVHDGHMSNQLQALSIGDVYPYGRPGISAKPILEALGHRNIRTLSLYTPVAETVAEAVKGLQAIKHLQICFGRTSRLGCVECCIEMVDERGFARTFHYNLGTPWEASIQSVIDRASLESVISFFVSYGGLGSDILPDLKLHLPCLESLTLGIASLESLFIPLFFTVRPTIRDVRIGAISETLHLDALGLASLGRGLADRLGMQHIAVLYLDNIVLNNGPWSDAGHERLATLANSVICLKRSRKPLSPEIAQLREQGPYFPQPVAAQFSIESE
ncbi:hypothetical protein EXIGLDRAFT_812034 [Exidia glandulosa HHB12029]|uniref:Uncharacterized protein n=1 Tax=Exidia glandulosa HHB12029 TaxID=1314781 RepID=A0A165LB86_EXIGL|nr:hypothetical protein EXIGLDRAFT_812034 [Exidia glandulosa HHB12029]